MTREEIGKLYNQIHYPSILIGKRMKFETAVAITRQQLDLCAELNKHVNYWNQYSGYAYSLHSVNKCWLGVRDWLKGSRDWDTCYGVNNPFLMGDAIITDKKENEYGSKNSIGKADTTHFVGADSRP